MYEGWYSQIRDCKEAISPSFCVMTTTAWIPLIRLGPLKAGNDEVTKNIFIRLLY